MSVMFRKGGRGGGGGRRTGETEGAIHTFETFYLHTFLVCGGSA